MIHPKRLLEGEGTEIERLLLASGRAARPSPHTKWRTGLLFFLVSIGTVSKAHAVALLGAKVRAWTVAQWLAVGVGTGAAGWVAVQARADVPADSPVAVVERAPRRVPAAPSFHNAQPRVVPSPEPAPAPPEPRVPVQAPTPSRAKRGTPLAAAPAAVDAPVERSIASEIDELDRARASLGAGEAKRAIDRLNRYDRMFPQGTLREEALRLRIEALVSNGERATARTLAQRFRGLYPDSPHTERLKALVKEP